MCRKACTEPQCLYKRALYLSFHHVLDALHCVFLISKLREISCRMSSYREQNVSMTKTHNSMRKIVFLLRRTRRTGIRWCPTEKKAFDFKTFKDFILKCSLILCVTDFTMAAAKQTLKNVFIRSTQVFRVFYTLSCQILHNALAFSFITTANVSLKTHQTIQIERK